MTLPPNVKPVPQRRMPDRVTRQVLRKTERDTADRFGRVPPPRAMVATPEPPKPRGD